MITFFIVCGIAFALLAIHSMYSEAGSAMPIGFIFIGFMSAVCFAIGGMIWIIKLL